MEGEPRRIEISDRRFAQHIKGMVEDVLQGKKTESFLLDHVPLFEEDKWVTLREDGLLGIISVRSLHRITRNVLGEFGIYLDRPPRRQDHNVGGQMIDLAEWDSVLYPLRHQLVIFDQEGQGSPNASYILRPVGQKESRQPAKVIDFPRRGR